MSESNIEGYQEGPTSRIPFSFHHSEPKPDAKFDTDCLIRIFKESIHIMHTSIFSSLVLNSNATSSRMRLTPNDEAEQFSSINSDISIERHSPFKSNLPHPLQGRWISFVALAESRSQKELITLCRELMGRLNHLMIFLACLYIPCCLQFTLTCTTRKGPSLGAELK